MTTVKSKKNIQSLDCNICAETKFKRKFMKCPFCDFESCISCVETFLMGIDDSRPRCMSNSCKKIWSYEFLASIFPSNFHNKKYLVRRATLLMEREKSLMPGTQHLVAAQILNEQKKKQIADLKAENKMLKEIITRNVQQIRLIEEEDSDDGQIKAKKEVFVRACPVDACRGFLSSALKCGICEVFACKDCFLPKNGRNDAEHKCNQDTVATIKLLASDTKPCPSCSTPIYKIHGCDQMYCTQCHTAFSWDKGTIEIGVVHNPHYYEFQRSQNGGLAPRVPGDVRCGGLPNLHDVLRVTGAGNNNILNISMTRVYQLVNHIIAVEIPHYPHNAVVDNTTLRIDYLRNKITDKQLISKLKQDIKKRDKDEAIRMSLDMFVNIMTDLFGNIISDSRNCDLHLNSIKELKNYTNKSLLAIEYRFENVTPHITEDFQYYRNRKTNLRS